RWLEEQAEADPFTKTGRKDAGIEGGGGGLMLLRVERLTKRFGELTANHQVDLSVERGQIHAIIGPNGAGKTTFFNLISGFYPPTSGRILFKGTNITGWPPERIAKKGIARTFQTTHLFEEATVLDNVIIGNRLRTRSGFWDVI